MDLFIYATIGILGLMFIFIGYSGGFQRLGLILAAMGVISMAVIGFIMYSGSVLYHSLIASSSGSQLLAYKADLIANNTNGTIGLILFAILIIFGLVLHYWESIWKLIKDRKSTGYTE